MEDTISPEVAEKEEVTQEPQAVEQEVPSFKNEDDMMDAFLGKGEYAQEYEPVEEQPTEDKEEPSQERADELLAKSESEGLTEEEVAELKAMGYEEEEAKTETVEETPELEQSWTPPVYADQLKELYPDASFESADGVNDAIYSLIADSKVNKEANQKLESALTNDPEFADFMKAVVVEGKSVAEAALEAGVDLSESVPEPTDPEYKDYILAQERKKEAAKSANQFKETRNNNLQRSVVEVQRYLSENQISKKDAEHITNKLDKVFDDIYNGKISPDFIKTIHDGLTAAEKIKNAEHLGTIKGKNENLKLVKKTFRKGDGMKKLGGDKTSIQNQPRVQYADDGIKDVLKMMGQV